MCGVNENRKQKRTVRKAVSRVVTCTGVGIILLLAVPAAVCGLFIAAVWRITDKAVSIINSERDRDI